MNTGRIGRVWERSDARSRPPLTGRMLDQGARGLDKAPEAGEAGCYPVRFDVRFSVS